MTETTPPQPRHAGGYRIGRIFQFIGLVIGLEGLLVYGSEPKEGPMIYVTFGAVAVFYIGYWLVRRFGPQSVSTD